MSDAALGSETLVLHGHAGDARSDTETVTVVRDLRSATTFWRNRAAVFRPLCGVEVAALCSLRLPPCGLWFGVLYLQFVFCADSTFGSFLCFCIIIGRVLYGHRMSGASGLWKVW